MSLDRSSVWLKGVEPCQNENQSEGQVGSFDEEVTELDKGEVDEPVSRPASDLHLGPPQQVWSLSSF